MSSLQMHRVGRIRTLIAKACGVLFSVAGGNNYSSLKRLNIVSHMYLGTMYVNKKIVDL